MSDEAQEIGEKPAWTKRVGDQCKKIGKKLWEQWFIIGMAIVIALAYAYPPLGMKNGLIRADILTTYVAVIIIFYLTGMSIKLKALLNALKSFKHWLLVLIITFLITPSLTFGLVALLEYYNQLNQYLLEGIIVMACVPTTISSCNVLTQSAGGNEAVAIINSVLGNALGVFISPALIMLFVGKAASVNVGDVFMKLGLTVIVPMIIGICFQFWLVKVTTWLKSKLNFTYINQSLLLFIIYSVFCDTFNAHLDLDVVSFVMTISIVVGLHFTYLLIAWLAFLPKFFKFTWEDRVAGLFCASQKTLTLGVPLISIMYANDTNPAVGLVVIPVMIIHPFQLLVAGILAPQIKARKPTYAPLDTEELDGLIISDGLEENHPQTMGKIDEDEDHVQLHAVEETNHEKHPNIDNEGE